MSFSRWRLSLFAFSFLVGIGMASWVTRTPAVRDAVGASTAAMGLVLFGLSVGSMAGVIAGGPLVRRAGTRPIIGIGAAFLVAGVTVVAIGSALGAAPGVFAGLLLFGIGSGAGEIALNIDGADVERRLGRPVLPAQHGCFSLGTLVGALVGIALTAANVPVLWHLLGCAAIMGALAVAGFRGLPTLAIGQVQAAQSESAGPVVVDDVADDAPPAPRRTRSVWLDPTLLLLGVALLALAFAEGSANDWLPLLTVDGLGLSEAAGSMVFAAFAAVMTIGRFSGQALVARLGNQAVLLASVVTSAVGVALVSFAAHPAVVVGGVALWGLGASLGFPVAISVAGDTADRPNERVSAVATAGYLAFLVGPPALGLLGEEHGLRLAILLVVALLAVAFAALVVRARLAPAPKRSTVLAESTR
ncbi:MFS transporter [Salana multivorans]